MYIKKIIISGTLYLLITTSNAEQYVMPPTSSTTGSVPIISDQLMEQCVEIYNKAEWLTQQLNNTYLNQYSQYEVDEYNRKASQVNQWTHWFNQHCAGKQSYSAYKAAQELNCKAGNTATQSCD